MLREEFISRLLGFIESKSEIWFAEEDTEEGHLKNFQDLIGVHNTEIQESVLGVRHEG